MEKIRIRDSWINIPYSQHAEKIIPDMLRLVLAAASPLLARWLEESPAADQVEILLRVPKIFLIC
jgi:hypothetical protein